ncbi:hypothetical protein ElyMa_005684500 [Elysia marginata]|uniref:CCHC-type domain-containing protein n=1 Tax=Elysia marginata TaxID=1093978 RepID=A0AAV4FGZ2_9GAST|nr:hypothetical protein ElyMa_005684500 [Elysia marginata]
MHAYEHNYGTPLIHRVTNWIRETHGENKHAIPWQCGQAGHNRRNCEILCFRSRGVERPLKWVLDGCLTRPGQPRVPVNKRPEQIPESGPLKNTDAPHPSKA